MKNTLRFGLMILFTLASSCAANTALEPAPGTMTSGLGRHQVTDSLSGVELTANAEAWRGLPEIVQQVIPIRITVRNHHGKAITIRDRDFSLVNAEGERYAAQSPEKIQGSVSVVSSTFYTGPSIGMTPYLSYYPNDPAVVQPFYDDPWWYNGHYGGTEEVRLPTKEMVAEAIPEMRIPDGGEISGFIYFSRIGDERRINLNMDVVETDGSRIGTISIPFVVEQKREVKAGATSSGA